MTRPADNNRTEPAYSTAEGAVMGSKKVPTRVTAEAAARNAAALIGFRALGENSLAHLPPGEGGTRASPETWRQEVSRLSAVAAARGLAIGLNADSVAKMRRVAAAFTADEIAALAARVRERRSTFAATHLLRLIAVESRADRTTLAGKAVRGSWSVRRLQRAAQLQCGERRTGGGRKPDVPDDDEQLVLMLEGLCVRWLRWTEKACPRLPSGVRSRVAAADQAVKAVRKALATAN